MEPNMALSGVRVLDCTQILAGPFCTMMLADMGADVVKIERPGGGDDTRTMGPPFINGESAGFLSVNRNKRSVVLDLKREEGAAILRRLATDADVMVQNLRPGVLDRLGLGYEQLRTVNPRLIYCSISGFGSTGPYRHRGGFDLVTQGMSGLMSVNGVPGAPPLKIGVPLTDLGAGMYAAYGILCAYVHRLKTGEGQHVDTSLLEAGVAFTFWESTIFFATGLAPDRAGSSHRVNAPYQPFATADGHVNVGAANQATWERMCPAIGRADLLDDPRFTTNAGRIVNVEALASILSPVFAAKPTGHWLRVLEAAAVPCGPIYEMAEVYSDPQVLAREMVVEQHHPIAGVVRSIGIPVKLSATPGHAGRPAPVLGQHTDEVLSAAGYSEGEIARLRESGVVG